MECDFLVCGVGNGGPLLGVQCPGVKGEQRGWNETGIVEELTLLLHARNAFINGVMFYTHPSMDEAFDEVLRGAGVTVLRRHCLHSPGRPRGTQSSEGEDTDF